MDDQATNGTLTPQPTNANAVAPADTAFPPLPAPAAQPQPAEFLKVLTRIADALTPQPAFNAYALAPGDAQPFGGAWPVQPIAFDCPEGKVQWCARCKKTFTADTLVPFCGQHCAETALASQAPS